MSVCQFNKDTSMLTCMCCDTDAVSKADPVVAGEMHMLLTLRAVNGHTVDEPRCFQQTYQMLLQPYFNYKDLTKVIVTLHSDAVAMDFVTRAKELANTRLIAYGNGLCGPLAANQ